MASSKSFLDTVKDRRTYHHLSKESTISDKRIVEIVEFILMNSPSAFNVQSARAVVLLSDQHDKLWAKADSAMSGMLPEEVYKGHIAPRIIAFKGAYGSVLFFEDEADLTDSQQKNATVAGLVPQWSEHSSGAQQVLLWMAFDAEGLGCSLQHYHMAPPVVQFVQEEWNIPATWKLQSQLVFGKPTGPPREKTYKPIEERVKVQA